MNKKIIRIVLTLIIVSLIVIIIYNANKNNNSIYLVLNIIFFMINTIIFNRLFLLHRGQKIRSRFLKRLENDVNKVYNKMDILVNAVEDIYYLDKDEFLKKAFDSAFELIPEAEKGSFYELDGDFFVPTLCKGHDFETLKKLRFSKDEIFLGFEFSKKKGIESYEIYVQKRDDEKFLEETVETFKQLGTYCDFTCLYAPIQVEGKNIGMICLDKYRSKGFSEISKRILKYYAQIISIFYTIRVFEEKNKKLNNQLITALVSAIEIKDKYTEGHGKRVQKYSVDIAKKMNLSKRQIENISIAALLHDIGKIGISTEILNKSGRLADEEYIEIKKHPEFSKKILDKIVEFSEVTELTLLHHERYDGLGYPKGLKGDEIPIEAQIIHLADAYDAMTTDRAYRKAMSKEDALKIIEEESGKQFHPEVAMIAIKEVF